jgi:fermentation-respiration switch protein FrsA (DUF1100 family)
VFVIRILLGLLLAYAALVALAWLFQERIAFPAPRARVPDPKEVGASGERVELVMGDGTRLVGWYLRAVQSGAGRWKAGKEGDPQTALHRPSPPFPALLWFYGNGENIASIWPILRDFQPPGTALFVVDYPGYGGSGGRATEARLYEAAESAYGALVQRPEVDRTRIYVYGRSLGSALASHVAAEHDVAGLVLESPFTSARDMTRQHYPVLPRFIVRLRLDNLAQVRRVRCPVLVFHGTADRIAPPAMGRQLAAAAPGPVELVLIHGAGHNDTYDVGGRGYRDKVWEFVVGTSAVRRLGG